MTEPVIVQRDPAFYLCVKPAGLLSESPGMPETLAALGGDRDIFPVHRLDREVGGVMVYARTKKAAAALSRAVSERQLEKEYLAVVSGCPEPSEGVWRDLLFKDSRKNKSFVVDRPRKGVKEAELSYRVQAQKDGMSLVRIRLHTGRSHQIRVQFASRKMPLLGDRKYGSKTDGPLALWSCRLSFPHPAGGQPVEIEKAPPEVWPWTLFPEEKRTLSV